MCDELENASRMDRPIIPLLMGGARMPEVDRLPPGAREVVNQKRNALEVSESYWDASFERLVPRLKQICDVSARGERGLLSGLSVSQLQMLESITDPHARARMRSQFQWQNDQEVRKFRSNVASLITEAIEASR